MAGGDVEEGPERFELNWPGKRQAIRAAQTSTTATLEPDKENSVNWDETQNIFIEGDNLEVLKILQKHYYGKIKMIYIDPPYNTGNDFVYADDYADSIGSYLELTGQADEGGKVSTNSESTGRFHSNWLNMMYPRLKLARNLLTQDGVIFISIDDYEAARLAQIGNEIFGADNALTSDCVGPFIWPKAGATAGHVVRNHEYIFAWARNKKRLPLFRLMSFGENTLIEDRAVKKISKQNPASTVTLTQGLRFEGGDGTFTGIIGKTETMEIHGVMEFVNGRLTANVDVTAGWAMKEQLESWLSGKETFDSKGQRIVEFFINKNGQLRYVKERGTFHPRTLLEGQIVGTTRIASREIEEVTGYPNPFQYAKPTDLIGYFLSFVTAKDDLILDFFAGSGTTAHSVFKQNSTDGQSRRFICVQLPEAMPTGSTLEQLGIRSISEFARERIKGVGNKFLEERTDEQFWSDSAVDLGFRAYKLVGTNFAKWKANSGLSEDELLELFANLAESANDDARPEALLTEVLLKLGFSLTEKIETLEIAGLSVFSVAAGLMLAYLDEHTQPTLDQLRAVVAQEPERLVILEDAFKGDDELKTNLAQECRTHNVELWTV
ncbi:site-specific DNA-methyltransferase [Corynebacterium zhongnanshanii]|uniref:site-specific DNA-methyltransferase n=1 Tax=Corynebacterium zhongnanshanii TaxID=2768834 RepID=UPI00192D536B